MSRIGPKLPPHLKKINEIDESDSNSDDGDLYGPALPSHLKPKCSSDELVQSPNREKRTQVTYDSSSDEEVIGPLPIDCIDTEQSSSADIEKRALKMKRKLLGCHDEGNKQPKREDWMIELPEIQRKNFGLGPRTFNRTDKPECVGRDQWTSTPNTPVNVNLLNCYVSYLKHCCLVFYNTFTIFCTGHYFKRKRRTGSTDQKTVFRTKKKPETRETCI